MRAVIYTRISQDRNGEQAGVDRQEAECRKHIAEKGWTLTTVYRDNDVSAYARKPRPEFERMLTDLPAIDVVVVWSADRLYRRLSDLERLVNRLGLTRVEALKSGDINLATADGRAVARILGSLAQRESEKMGERISAAQQQRARAGGWSGGPRPLGYTADCTQLVEHEADLIRWAYRHIDSGGSVNSVARHWADEGMAGSRGATMVAQQVRTVLMRPRNAGLAAYLGQIVGESESPPLIDVETWRRVNAILTSNRKLGRTETTLLSGIAVCGKCGGPVVGDSVRGVMAYRCKRNKCAYRKRAYVDALVTDAVLDRLESHRDEIRAAVQPPQAVDATRELREELATLAALRDAKTLSEGAYRAAEADVQTRIRQAQTAPKASPSGAVQALLSGDIRAGWEAAPTMVKRQVLRVVLESVVIFPRKGEEFNWV